MNLDCWGCGKKPPKDGPLFLVCPKCRDHKLIKCNFCSQECFKANWARHEEWHKVQWKNARRIRKTTPKKEWTEQRGLSACGKRYSELLREASGLQHAANYHGAFKVLREAIELMPEQPAAYHHMGNALVHSGDAKGAARYFLLAEERCPTHGEDWATSIALACNELAMCPDAPRPSWWNDEDLLRLSAEAVAVRDTDAVMPLIMRASALYSCYHAEGRTRTAAELREAVRCFTRAAETYEGRGDTYSADIYRKNAALALEKMSLQLEALVLERAPRPEVPTE